MNKLFNYRPDGKTITTNDGDKEIMVIRRGPRGIVAKVRGRGPIVIWDNDNADAHVADTEETLIARIIELLNV